MGEVDGLCSAAELPLEGGEGLHELLKGSRGCDTGRVKVGEGCLDNGAEDFEGQSGKLDGGVLLRAEEVALD
jgi:hypothetical protein